MYQQKDMSGALFRAEKKSDDDRDYNGSITVRGEESWVSGWIRESTKTGRKFLSLKVKPK